MRLMNRVYLEMIMLTIFGFKVVPSHIKYILNPYIFNLAYFLLCLNKTGNVPMDLELDNKVRSWVGFKSGFSVWSLRFEIQEEVLKGGGGLKAIGS